MKPPNGRRRVVIEEVSPQVDGGRHAVRRIAGDEVAVTAAIYADGRDEVAARLLYRHSGDKQWWFAPMYALGNDLWRGTFRVDKLGAWSFCLLGWVDHFRTWSDDLKKRIAAQADPAQADSLSIDAMPAAAPKPAAGLNAGSNPAAQDIPKIGRGAGESLLVDDLLSGAQYVWRDRNYVALRPGVQPAHIFRVSSVQ